MGRDEEYLAFLRQGTQAVAGPALSLEDERAAHRADLARLRTPPVALVEELALAGAEGLVRARLYHPMPGTALPGFVFFHGGGFSLGDVASYDPIVRALVVATGCAFVSVEYALAPESPYPAAVDDALDATLDVARRARELGLDRARLGVAGDSAGANLATVTALDLRGESTLAMQLLIYGVYDLADDPAVPLDPDGLSLYDGGWPLARERYLDGADPFEPHASPMLAKDLTGLPPAVVVTAEYDRLRTQGDEYAARMRAAGVRVTLIDGRGLDHGFLAAAEFARRPAQALADIGMAVRTLAGI